MKGIPRDVAHVFLVLSDEAELGTTFILEQMQLY